jgi:DNA helicase-2/ATP-dependent DNA helicase PcrA
VEEIPAELVEREGMPVTVAGIGKRYVQWEDAVAPEPAVASPWMGSPRPEKASTPAKTAKASGKTPYYNGAVVKHAKFGIGTVQRSEGAGDDLKIIVSFPGHGVKTLAVKYANLEVI